MSFLSTEFTYNSIDSDSMNVQLVRVGEDTVTQAFSSTKNLEREHLKFRGNFYLGADTNIYTLSMKLMKIDDEEEFTPSDRMELLQWLNPDGEFHAFTTLDFPGIEFVVQFTKIQFINVANNRGYFELECESNHPHPFSELETIEYDLSDNTTTTIIELPNNCNTGLYFTPNVMEFTLVGDSTSFNLKNLTNGNNILNFTGLPLLETVAINSMQEIITESGNEVISKFNFGYKALDLCYGLNRLEVTGKCILKFQLQYPVQI